MSAYNFQARFEAPIKSGQKWQTMRPTGTRRHVRPGELIQLYTGMRTNACRKIIPDQRCLAVLPVRVYFSEACRPGNRMILVVSSAEVPFGHRLAFADREGFANWQCFEEAWAGIYGNGHWTGFCIQWTPYEPRRRRSAK